MIINNNVFNQQPITWVFSFRTKYKYLVEFSEFLELFTNTVVSFEEVPTNYVDSKPEDYWCLEAYLDFEPDQEFIKKLTYFASEHNLLLENNKIEQLDDKDWVSEVQKNFSPITVGQFFVHSAYYKDQVPENLTPIFIDPGRAFGTGEHQTTKGCLQIINNLSGPFEYMLDMGCGSAILAIAMAKKWSKMVVACDIDEQAVIIAQDNVILNKVEKIVHCIHSDGFSSAELKNNKFNLIVANILANPLQQMATELISCLAAKGKVILSGFSHDQQEQVVSAYTPYGLKLEEVINNDDWVAVLLSR